MPLRAPSALLWQRILRTDPDMLFQDIGSQLLNRHEFDRLAQPGYVGPQYRPGGLLFISMNPGAGSQDGRKLTTCASTALCSSSGMRMNWRFLPPSTA